VRQLAVADLFQSPIVIQGIGVIALILCFVSYQSERYQKLMWIRAASEFVFGIHFFLLHVISGSVLQFVGGVRNISFIALRKNKVGLQVAIGLFCVLFTVSGILAWEGPISLIPIIAKNISTIVYAMHDTRKIRLIELPVYCLWLFFNYRSGSIAGMINAAFSIVSICVAIARFDNRNRRDAVE
jgi:hypothetical protein